MHCTLPIWRIKFILFLSYVLKRNSPLLKREANCAHYSSGIVERAKRERAWKSPHARKASMRRREREKWGTADKPQAFELMRCSHNAELWLALQWKSVNICQNAPALHAKQPREKKLVSGVSFTCNKLNIPRNLPMTRAMTAQWEKETHWMRSIELKGYTNFTLQNRSALNRERSQAWALSVVPHFSLSAPLLAFLAGVIFTRARISLALLSL